MNLLEPTHSVVVVAVFARAPFGVAFESLGPTYAIIVFTVVFLAVAAFSHAGLLLDLAGLVATTSHSLGPVIVLAVRARAFPFALNARLQAHTVVLYAAARTCAVDLGRWRGGQTFDAAPLLETWQSFVRFLILRVRACRSEALHVL